MFLACHLVGKRIGWPSAMEAKIVVTVYRLLLVFGKASNSGEPVPRSMSRCNVTVYLGSEGLECLFSSARTRSAIANAIATRRSQSDYLANQEKQL